MKKIHSFEDYEITANSLNVVCGMALLSIARFDCSRKDIILRNFIAKSSMSLKGILALWNLNNFQDCWVLYRVIVDRYLHLSSIAKKPLRSRSAFRLTLTLFKSIPKAVAKAL